jgi:transcriptional regulator with XRE-family HTH domain
VSVTWYTWLEQGRGGVPSEDVLERLAIALELDAAGREVLFLLAQQQPPPLKQAPAASVSPSLQRVLDSLTTPAYVTTLIWTIVAWNRAAVAVFGDYGAMPERDRNVMRRIFAPGSIMVLPEHERDRRQTVAAFRVDVARAGDSQEAAELIAELTETSADFRRLWTEHELRTHGVMLKLLVRPGVGEILLESVRVLRRRQRPPPHDRLPASERSLGTKHRRARSTPAQRVAAETEGRRAIGESRDANRQRITRATFRFVYAWPVDSHLSSGSCRNTPRTPSLHCLLSELK